MRIAILTNAFPPDGRGGAERVAYMQADGFGVFGHEVKVWAARKALRLRPACRQAGSGQAPSGKRSAVEEQHIHGIEVERFPSLFGHLAEMPPVRRLAYHLFADALPAGRRAGARRDVASRIIAWKPDVLLTHNLTGCGIGTARLVQSRGVRWIHTLHDIQLTDPSGQEMAAWSRTAGARLWRAFWSAWRRRSFGRPDVIVSPTQWLLDWHTSHKWFGRGDVPSASRGMGRTERYTASHRISVGATQRVAPTEAVIPNPVSTSVPRDRSLRRPAMIAYVGRLSEDKGFDVFLDVLKRLDISVVGRATVVGDGPMMERVHVTPDSRLDLRGPLSPEDARRAIAEADVLVAPSCILENQQTILLEAMAEGTPVVASDTGGTRETLEGTGCPVIADADGQKIAEAVREVLSGGARWSGLSRAMQERAKRHDPERYFSSLFGLLSG